MNHRLATSLAASVFFTSAGCALLAGVDGERHLGEATTSSSSSSSGSGGGGGGKPACSPAAPPAPPTIVGAGGADVLTFALRSLDLGGPKKKVGFDLDSQCTCPGKTACQEPAWATSDHCDDPDGRDNGSGNAFAALNVAFGAVISSIELSNQASKGNWSVLIKVSGYNGGDDDDQVEVALYTSPGLGDVPKWDGTDAWPVAPMSLVDAVSVDQPIDKDSKAYVTNRTLVAHLPGATVVLRGSGVHLEVDLSSVVFAATLEKKDTGAVELVGGTLAGSWLEPAVFQSLSGLRINNGMRLCVDDVYYNTVKKVLCDEFDLSSTGAAAAPCDALSFGMGFAASPAMLGSVVDFPMLGGSCAAGKDPVADLCGS